MLPRKDIHLTSFCVDLASYCLYLNTYKWLPKQSHVQSMKGCPVFSIKSTWCFSVLHSGLWTSHLLSASKSYFSCRLPIVARKGTLHANVLKTPLPGQRLTSSWCHEIMLASVHVTDDDRSFCALECLYIKPQSRALTARELPCCLVNIWICAGVTVYLVPPRYLVHGDTLPRGKVSHPGLSCPQGHFTLG